MRLKKYAKSKNIYWRKSVKNLFAGQVLVGLYTAFCCLNSPKSEKELKRIETGLSTSWTNVSGILISLAGVTSSYNIPFHISSVLIAELQHWLWEKSFLLSVKATSSPLKTELVYLADWSLGDKLPGPRPSRASTAEPRQLWQTTVKPM